VETSEPDPRLARHIHMLRLAVAICLLGCTAAAQPRIVFTGNANISSAELLNAIDDPFEADGSLQQEVFERDLLLLSAYYWDRGYARVRIGDPKISATEIVIPITENEVFTIGSIAVTGDPTPRMRARHHDALKTRTGALFSRTQIANDREQLSRYYEERGYAYVNVLPLTKIDIATRTVALTFEITRGKVARIEHVDLDCPRVPDAGAVIRVYNGDRYDVRKFEESKAAIRALGSLGKDDVVLWSKRGSTDELVILGIECP
jgi:outer membrane protein insertion porin family